VLFISICNNAIPLGRIINSLYNGDKREKIRAAIDEVLIKYGSASGYRDEKWNQRISTAKLCSATQRRYRRTNDNFQRQTLRENFPGARTGSCCVGKSYIENFSSPSPSPAVSCGTLSLETNLARPGPDQMYLISFLLHSPMRWFDRASRT